MLRGRAGLLRSRQVTSYISTEWGGEVSSLKLEPSLEGRELEPGKAYEVSWSSAFVGYVKVREVYCNGHVAPSFASSLAPVAMPTTTSVTANSNASWFRVNFCRLRSTATIMCWSQSRWPALYPKDR